MWFGETSMNSVAFSPDSRVLAAWTCDGKLRLKQGTSTLASFDIVSIPDRPPTISLRGDPKSNSRGALTLGYKVDDDYGIVSAEAQFAKQTALNSWSKLIDRCASARRAEEPASRASR